MANVASRCIQSKLASGRRKFSASSSGGSRFSEEQLKIWMVEGMAGSVSSQRKLLEATGLMLRSFFSRRLPGNNPEVDDLVQDTLVAVHTRRTSYDGARPFTPWLYSIARHKLCDHFRSPCRRHTSESLEAILVTEGFESSSNARIDLQRLLMTLPISQAQAIWQTRIVGLSIAEAAQRSGMGQSAIKVSVHRGLRALFAQTKLAKQHL